MITAIELVDEWLKSQPDSKSQKEIDRVLILNRLNLEFNFNEFIDYTISKDVIFLKRKNGSTVTVNMNGFHLFATKERFD